MIRERCKEAWEGVKVLRGCVSWWEGVMVLGRGKGDWGGVAVDQKCDIDQRDVKGIRKVCQLMERCDVFFLGLRRCGKV